MSRMQRRRHFSIWFTQRMGLNGLCVTVVAVMLLSPRGEQHASATVLACTCGTPRYAQQQMFAFVL